MKKIITYCCEVCFTEFENEQECLKCEKSHIKATRIDKQISSYQDLREKNYPEKLIIEMEDGTKREYRRIEKR